MCTLGYLVWLSEPLIGQVHSGLACLVIYPGMTLVNLILIGHYCDHLVGELNCLASTCWLIAQARLCSSTLCSHINNIIDMPMCSVAYVQKGYAVSNLVDVWQLL